MRSTSSTPTQAQKGSTSTAWTLRGRRKRQPPSTRTTERGAKQEESESPLTDSNRRLPPYHCVCNYRQSRATDTAYLSRFPGLGFAADRRRLRPLCSVDS